MSNSNIKAGQTTRRPPKQDPTLRMITARIAQMTFNPAREAGQWLARLGMEVTEEHNGAVVRLHNPWLNFTTAITDDIDPLARSISIAFLLFGAYWTYICPDLPSAVNKEWKRRRSAAPSAAASEEGG